MDLSKEMTAIHPIHAELKSRLQACADWYFDSGVGINHCTEIVQHLPNEQIIYYADTAHVPYGPRSDQEIRQLTAQAIEWLYRRGCKMAVVW
jgi:glutamate racemase